MDILNILGRTDELFMEDLLSYDLDMTNIISKNRFLVIGGGGSIGQAVSKELFKRGAKALHVVDLSENYLVELVRDIRSSYGYLVDDFDTFALDCGSRKFKDFMQNGKYDYVLNLSALKHVRSENSQYSMDRMIKTNLINTINTLNWAINSGACKYFAFQLIKPQILQILWVQQKEQWNCQ
jgi:FlaA1/EpsC-like NDP-sugar epimerase